MKNFLCKKNLKLFFYKIIIEELFFIEIIFDKKYIYIANKIINDKNLIFVTNKFVCKIF